jgi:hypothetical protein
MRLQGCVSIGREYAIKANATLSADFRISIPKSLCEAQGQLPGQKLAFVPEDGGVPLMAVPELMK